MTNGSPAQRSLQEAAPAGLLRTGVGMRLLAVTLVLLTLTSLVFAALNFQQRLQYRLPDDGVLWWDTPQGVVARQVAPNSPADRAGLLAGDRLVAVNGAPVYRASDVTRLLVAAGLWARLHYSFERAGVRLETDLVTASAPRPLGAENYLRLVGLAYLLIGLFVFLRRWSAPGAIHFYLFCLSSFVFYSFHYSGKLSAFDREVYWGNVLAGLLAPTLLVHFALVFPRPRGRRLTRLALYAPAAFLAGVHVATASGWLGFTPWIGARIALDQLELAYLAACFLAAAGLFWSSYRHSPSGLVRQQLKLTLTGLVLGTGPFVAFYIVPFLAGRLPGGWMNLTVLPLVLVPLAFAYAIVRYRLMDVDMIFRRGLVYTAATAGVVAVYFALAAATGLLFHAAWPSGPAGAVVAIVAAAFLFQPLRDWVQERLDRFFYRDRLDYRRTLLSFGRTLSTELRLEPMLDSVLDRISQALLVDRLAIFLPDAGAPGGYRLARAMGLTADGSLDLSFLGCEALTHGRGYLFYEPGQPNGSWDPAARRSLERLGLHYYLACRLRDRTVAVLGLGKTIDGDYLTSDDLALLFTLAGYIAIAVENASLYRSLEQKAGQIEQLKEFQENIIESLRVGVLTLDLEGRVETWNSFLEQLLQRSRQQALGQPLEQVLPVELAAEILACTEATETASIPRFPLRTPAGEERLLHVTVTPLVNRQGERLGRLVLLDDITERVRLEEQMQQNEKLASLGLLAAGVAHEVNTPLAVIANYAQMLARQLAADDTRQVLVEKIVRQTFRASEIVNHLLNFSRARPAEFSEVNLNAVIEEALGLVRPGLAGARIQIELDLEPSLAPIRGHAHRLQQVFVNLLLNARDAMPSGGRLTIATRGADDRVLVEIRDTGVGIPPEALGRIFDPFFTTKAPGRGTGLGLSVSYGIVREHGGSISVDSRPGSGTTFRLEFPVRAGKPVHV